MSLKASRQFFLLSFLVVSSACTAPDVPDSGENQEQSPATSASGGSVAPQVAEPGAEDPGTEEPNAEEPTAASGGFGGAADETEDVITHPLFGAGSYSSTAPTDPCVAAQRWEESTNLDLTTGALILHDGVVYEVTGIGKSESTWADEWTAPPCTRDDGHCEDLAYQVVATCD